MYLICSTVLQTSPITTDLQSDPQHIHILWESGLSFVAVKKGAGFSASVATKHRERGLPWR